MAGSESQIDWVFRVFGIRLDALPTLDEIDDPDFDAETERAELQEMGLDISDVWESAVDAFERATEEADVQIRALQEALRETDDPDLHDIADSGLNALTGNTRVPLMAAIVEANGGPVKLKAAAPKVLKAVGAFRQQLGSEQVQACDRNPFDVEVSLAQTYAGALDQLAHAARLSA